MRRLVAAVTFLLLAAGSAAPGPRQADDRRFRETGSDRALLSVGATHATPTAARWDTPSASTQDAKVVASLAPPRDARAIAAVAYALERDCPVSDLVPVESHPQRGPPSA